jgi:hypothetical protein
MRLMDINTCFILPHILFPYTREDDPLTFSSVYRLILHIEVSIKEMLDF